MRPKWRNGRRGGFKIHFCNRSAGSSPALGTKYMVRPHKNPQKHELNETVICMCVPFHLKLCTVLCTAWCTVTQEVCVECVATACT